MSKEGSQRTSNAWKMGEIARLRKENAELRRQLAEARSRAENVSDYRVHIVPEGCPPGKAFLDVQSDARPGDRVRFVGGGNDWVLSVNHGWVQIPDE